MERRLFLRSLAVSGGALATTGILASCKSSTGSPVGAAFEQDAPLVTAGAEFEAMGIATYEAAAASKLITDGDVLATAVQYMNDHKGHLNELNALLENFGFDQVDPTGADPAPGVASVTDQESVLNLALSVEFDAATFYFSGIVNQIQSVEARRVFANILPVETAHFTAFKSALNYTPAINSHIFEELTSGLETS
jgi:rubrerythrin